MATYINYGEGEDDATVQAAEWLRVLLREQAPEKEADFYSKFKELYGDDDDLVVDVVKIFDFFLDSSEDLFSSIAEARTEERVKEVESFFAVVMSFLSSFEDMDALDKSTERLCKIFVANAQEQPEVRLRLLMMLYNTFNNPKFECRFRVFKYILDYAAQAGQFDQVTPYLEYLDSWICDWDPYLTVADKRQLFLDISRHLRNLGKRIDAFRYLKRYLLLYQGEKPEEVSSKAAQEGAKQVVQDTLQLPSVMQVDDILALDVVKHLGKSKPGKELITLLNIFLSGGVDELRDFHKKNAKVFQDFDISLEDVMGKVRLLTLSTLCQGKAEMPLTTVAKALQEKDDNENVERWVVKAISEGVIDGRIDQINRKVLVKSTFQRKFEKDEWQFLDSKLTQWIDNLENLIGLIQQQKKGLLVPDAKPKSEEES